MNYPRYNHYLVFSKSGKDKYHIKNYITEDEWEVSAFYAKFLKSLDGKIDPFEVYSEQLSDQDIEYILNEMAGEGLLDYEEGFTTLGIGSAILPLWKPNITIGHRFFGALWNKILMVTWLPLFIAGFYVFLSYNWDPVERGFGTLTGYILGFGFGMFLHELSHAFSCIGYSSKNQFFEMGVMIHSFLPGAYVMIDYSEMRNRFKRAQINAAGVECNMALCGLFLCCLKLAVVDSTALIIAALLNFVLAIFNTTMISGIDGFGIFREIFANSDDFMDRAKNLIFDRKNKRLLCNKGINGKATIAACYILVLMQALLPIVLIMNVISIVSAFFI